jgi:hypothetical protein
MHVDVGTDCVGNAGNHAGNAHMLQAAAAVAAQEGAAATLGVVEGDVVVLRWAADAIGLLLASLQPLRQQCIVVVHVA